MVVNLDKCGIYHAKPNTTMCRFRRVRLFFKPTICSGFMGLILTQTKPMDSKMSCYQLSDKHHASIAHYVGEKMGFSLEKTATLADKLKRVNIQSVNYRYDQKKPARKCNMENRVKLDQHGFFDAIRCWAYQSCDNPGNLDYDILVAFLFDLVPDNFSTEMEIKEWGIY